ncbi:extracellular solute-binding protein [Natrinema altunense]|uniref:Extracellular solute-binding protein family 1 n=1 Tax=Natrinema altunense (strain JCM 12890 / CGMCC 1.3731 / AJ2) TaxID=1227494 RepID=L9ZMY0_NATA2|nr:extracellular solute-binding protein [Natrinema altunense]ELY87416.1 extracellular solute-binding protein family 1 [Natrinema altunense JCM 12890]
MNDEQDDQGVSRRRALQVGSAFGAASLAGCLGIFGDDEGTNIPSLAEFRGSGSLVDGRPAPGGTSIEELPDLSGELALYIGGGEGGIYYEFVEMLQEIYPDFEVYPTDNNSASLAQTIVEEAGSGASQADVFWSIDASSLGFVAENDAYEPLSDETVEAVGNSQFVGDDNAWAGVAGRARAVPYNTSQLSESDIPNTVQDFPDTSALQDSMGWAPTYGAFKSFVTAMRLLRGDDETRNWLRSMKDAGTERYSNEYAVSEAVANGSQSAGFANHYYAMRVKNKRPDAPIDLAFTEGDAGALINVAGALKVQGTQRGDLVDDFVRHLLSSEAQEFFATISFAYPMIDGVDPVGGLPSIGDLSPPEIDLAELANIEPTLELMDDAGVSG